MARSIDWATIQRDWELDQWSDRELGRRHNVSHVAIGKRAAGSPDSSGVPTRTPWVKRLAGRVQERTNEILATDGVADPESVADLVEQAAQARAEVTRQQRRECETLRGDLELMGNALRRRLKFASDLPKASDELLDSITRDGDRYLRMRERLHEMARKAYSLDTSVDGDPGIDVDDEELIDALYDRISRGNRGASPEAEPESEG